MSDNSGLSVTPATLPAMKAEDVKQRAQRILDLRGTPPYRTITMGEAMSDSNSPAGYVEEVLSPDEVAVISEFVQFWMPYLTIKEKK